MCCSCEVTMQYINLLWTARGKLLGPGNGPVSRSHSPSPYSLRDLFTSRPSWALFHCPTWVRICTDVRTSARPSPKDHYSMYILETKWKGVSGWANTRMHTSLLAALD